MCYKEEVQKRDSDKINKRLEDFPEFITLFIESNYNLKSKTSGKKYLGTFQEFFQYFINKRIIDKSDVKKIELNDLEKIHLPDIMKFIKHLGEDKDINGIYQEGNKPSTINRKIAEIRSLFSFLDSSELLVENIMKKVQRYSGGKNEVIVAELTDMQNLISNMEDNIKNEYTLIRNISIIKLFMGSGIRLSELVGLDLDDLYLEDKENSFINIIGKGNVKSRDSEFVDINESARIALMEYLKIRDSKKIIEKNAVFVSGNGRRLTDQAIYKFIKQYSNGKISPHMFRKGLGDIIYQETGDIQAVADQLRHSPSVAAKYYRRKNKKIKKVMDF